MAYSQQQVISVRHWSEQTFSLVCTRPPGFQFEPGEFVTLGLRIDGHLLARAYSMVSASDAEELEFLSIHVPDGPFTSHLAKLQAGDPLLVNDKATGSLTLRHLLPGRHLYMLATGTGLAPFMSLIQAPALYEHYQRVVLVHTVRTPLELAYRQLIEARVDERLRYVPTVTRAAFETMKRGTYLFRVGLLSARLNLPPADPRHDRVMLCGNPNMLGEMRLWLEERGWFPAAYDGPGSYAAEKAFLLREAD